MTNDFLTGVCVGAGGLLGVVNLIAQGERLWRGYQARKAEKRRGRFYGGPFDGDTFGGDAIDEVLNAHPDDTLTARRMKDGIVISARYQRFAGDLDLYAVDTDL